MAGVINRVRSFIGEESSEDGLEPAATSAPGFEHKPDLGIDEGLEILSNRRRRLAVRFMSEHATGEVELSEIAEFIAAETYGPEFGSMDRKRVYIAMYQAHGEKLVDAGVMKPVPDGQSQTYVQGEAAKPLFKLLTTAEDVLEVD